MEKQIFVCRNGRERSPTTSDLIPESSYLEGGWSYLLATLEGQSESQQTDFLQKNYGGEHLTFIFDKYEEEDPSVKARFSTLLKMLDKANIEYEKKTSSKLMQEIVAMQMRERAL